MQRNRKFDFAIKNLFLLAFWLIFLPDVARAESVHGKFFNGQAYSGEYLVAEATNSDGMRVHPVTVRLKVDGEKFPLPYSYIADDIPSVKSNDAGFLLIVVSSGGMEGSVTYNYVVPIRGKLASIGTVQTTLHLGKIESIDVQSNKGLEKKEINELVEGIVRYNPSALTDPLNAYPTAILLLLGQGKFLTPDDDSRLSKLYVNKEISDDPVLLKAIKTVIGKDVKENGEAQASNGKVVVSNRAYFYNYPESSNIGKSYLIKGGVVNLVKKSDDGQYWLVDYVSSHGRRAEKWLRCEDIGYCR
ncbi:hypothetical protein OEJ37_21615 [Burkholderia sp. BKH01]|uniref:hypothetical protein n=1 Tax=Burkholderia sp. BKH01 TaxID=2769262 RepID=UPI0021E006B0|nr:hypothetical protein [Burkholderia sp. BKH01]MCU9955964.1 hypothetical protein [Burkholderia sp. BKH01]